VADTGPLHRGVQHLYSDPFDMTCHRTMYLLICGERGEQNKTANRINHIKTGKIEETPLM